MPKVGMEPLRRRALIDAAIAAIGDHRSLDVTMSEIAGRAGVSAALAHHYFGAKEQLLEAAMGRILTELAVEARHAMKDIGDPSERLRRVVRISFSEQQFRPEIVSAWLAFYVEAQRSHPLRRLLRIYARRLNSTLVEALLHFMPRPRAIHVAEGTAAMIDGLYIRRALAHGAPDATTAIRLVDDYLNLQLARHA